MKYVIEQTSNAYITVYTKFEMTALELSKIEGVAEASTIKRYKFKLKIADLFTFSEVESNIKKAFENHII